MYLHSMFLLQHVHVVVSWGTTVNMLACIIVLSGFRRGARARCSCTSADSAVPPRGAPRKLVLHACQYYRRVQHGARPAEGCRVQQSYVHQGVCVVSRCCCLIASDAVVPGTQVPSTRFNAAWTARSDSCVNSD